MNNFIDKLRLIFVPNEKYKGILNNVTSVLTKANSGK